MGACVGGVVAVGTTVAGGWVAVAGGWVGAVTEVLFVGGVVAVGSVAPLFAVFDDGLLVAVGSGSSCEEAPAAFVAVGEGSCRAASGAPERSSSSPSSGAAGGGASWPSDEDVESPLRAVVALGESPPVPQMPSTLLATRPPETDSVPPAAMVMMMALRLMTALLVPDASGFPGGHVPAATLGFTRSRSSLRGFCYGSLYLVIVRRSPYLTAQTGYAITVLSPSEIP